MGVSDEMNRLIRNARTNVIIKENGSAPRVEVLEPSKVVNLAINDHPLKRGLKLGRKALKEERSYEVTSFVVLCHVVAGELLELSGCRHEYRLLRF